MAQIVGMICTSHTPTIGFAVDGKKQADPVWKPIFEAYEPIKAWLAEKKPDVMFLIYNDHVTSFFFDHYSPFCLGVGEQYSVADEGGGPRNLPPIRGHGPLAWHIGHSLVADEFDISFFQDKPLDHGCFSPMSVLMSHDDGGWQIPIVPFQMGVLQFPVPSASRCFKLGQAVRTAIESYPEDLKVVIVATGGLSHQVHGERCGFNNPAWDEKLLDIYENDPIALTRMTHADHARLGGMESAEFVMWLMGRGTMSYGVKRLHRSYYLPSMTAIATALYENEAEPMSEEVAEAARAKAVAQLEGIEQLEGTYPFDLERSVTHYRLNKFLHDLIYPAHRPGLPRGRGGDDGEGGPQRAGAGHGPPARLARADAVRRDLLRAGEVRRRGRGLQPARLCRDARPDAGRLPEDPQRPGHLLRRRRRGARQGGGERRVLSML